MKRASELEWLKYFYENIDLGPADEDVVEMMKEEFVIKTKKKMPKGYKLHQNEQDFLRNEGLLS